MKPDHVSLVAMGYRGIDSAEEDLLCAEIIASGLSDKEKAQLTKDYKDKLNSTKQEILKLRESKIKDN